MKKSNLLELLSDIIDVIFYLIVIINVCIAIYNHDWTRGIFFLLAASLAQNSNKY